EKSRKAQGDENAGREFHGGSVTPLGHWGADRTRGDQNGKARGVQSAPRIFLASCRSSARTSNVTPPIHKLGFVPPTSSAPTTASIPADSSAPFARSASMRERKVLRTTNSDSLIAYLAFRRNKTAFAEKSLAYQVPRARLTRHPVQDRM